MEAKTNSKSSKETHSNRRNSKKRVTATISSNSNTLSAMVKRKKKNREKVFFDGFIEKTSLNGQIQSSPTNHIETEPALALNVEQVPVGPRGQPLLYGDDYRNLKATLREITVKKRHQCYLVPNELGLSASLATVDDQRVPLFLNDIQHLILYSLQGPRAPQAPNRWCKLVRFNSLVNTTVFIVENVSVQDYFVGRQQLPFLEGSTFRFELLSPFTYKSDVVRDLSMVPLTAHHLNNYRKKFGDIAVAVAKSPDIFDTTRNLFPKHHQQNRTEGGAASSSTSCLVVDNSSLNNQNSSSINNSSTSTKSKKQHCQLLPKSDCFPRTQLLLSSWQMIEEDYPLPIHGLLERKFVDYVLTQDCYDEVGPHSQMFGVDCEMCITSTGDSELTQVSIVDESLKVIYSTLVKPYNPIVNYLTKFSGITAKMMSRATKRLPQVQQEIRSLLPRDAILIGQSLSNDMHALKMMHPYVIDTSVIFNLTGDPQRKSRLKFLAQRFLREDIQGGWGHNSVEDSKSALKLVQLKLTKDLQFGDLTMSSNPSSPTSTTTTLIDNNNVNNSLDNCCSTVATNMLMHATRGGKSAYVVGVTDFGGQYQYYVNKGDVSRRGGSGDDNSVVSVRGCERITCESRPTNEDVVEAVRAFVCTQSCAPHSLSLGHVRVEGGTTRTNSEGVRVPRGKVLQRLERWLNTLYENVPTSTLFITVLSGTTQENGACFIRVKNEL